jgi:predicted nucleotidyltransferase component of viral defense system
MMSLSEIRSYYPDYLHNRGEFLLREYLQYKILELLFQSNYASKFVFLGGTCLRIVHGNRRFSEDLDFDNFNLAQEDFEDVSQAIKAGLERQGFEVEMRNVFRGAYHCYIRFPGLLYETGLSGHREAKILINLDTEPQGFQFHPESVFLNQFDVFTNILSTPPDLLLSQKIATITQRKRPKGRDFFDTVFLLGKTGPNYEFLEQKLKLSDPSQLRQHLIEVCRNLDFQELAKDVQPFLFNPEDIRRVLLFPEYVKDAAL